MNSDIVFTSFNEIKKRFRKLGKCNHVASQMCTKHGIYLPCCSGNSMKCKQETFNLMSDMIRDLCGQIDELKGIPPEKRQKENVIEKLQEPKTVNNFYFQQNNICLSNEIIIDTIKTGFRFNSTRDQIYFDLWEQMDQNPKEEILKLTKGNPRDNFNAQKIIHNILLNAKKQLSPDDPDFPNIQQLINM